MKTTKEYFDWQSAIANADGCAIGSDFIIIDKPVLGNVPKEPFKVNVTTVILCEQGSMSGNIDLVPFGMQAPGIIILLADRILELDHLSTDFSGKVLIMSSRFTDNLLIDIQEKLPLTLSIENKPCLPLNKDMMEGLENYFTMMKKAVTSTDNPDRIKVARHLMLAYMYGISSYFHPTENESRSNRELLTERFLSIVKQDYRNERLLIHYADKLCLTPKHLSKVIKETTGKSANNWIDEHVMLDAKAMLKSTDMTIQQISDALNFDNASFFTKYFKRHLGLTPKEYRGLRAECIRQSDY